MFAHISTHDILVCVITARMTSNNFTHFPSINLVSFNSNGLCQDSKRKLVFNKLKSQDSLIILQETKCTKTLEKKPGKGLERKNLFYK